MDPGDFAQKYFQDLSSKATKSFVSEPAQNISPPKARAKNGDPVEILPSTVDSILTAQNRLPLPGEYIEVTNGKFSGEIAEVLRAEEGLGVVQAKPMPWSVRSLLVNSQGESLEKDGCVDVTRSDLEAWLCRDESPKPMGLIAVHRENFKKTSCQAVLESKAQASRAAAPWRLGTIVRQAVQKSGKEELSKAKYITLRMFSRGWVLLCRKKLWKMDDPNSAALFTKILSDLESARSSTKFVADEEVGVAENTENLPSQTGEASGFVLMHASTLRSTLGKVGEKAVLLELKSDAKESTAIQRDTDVESSRRGPPRIVTVLEKHDDTGEVSVELAARTDAKSSPERLKVHESQLCSFVTM